ncbi:MAG: SDR family NAD(P)-dependent oxidoreductase [Myxococcales bacterium]|nr:SDR family NAD(P)-dependent oxidoreductase [Myxococcales bacterium]
MRFRGRTVVITGASLGVGLSTARRFHAEGANVVLVARRQGPLDEAAATLSDTDRVMVCAADVLDLQRMGEVFDAAVQRWGALHGLVNNAGLHHRGPVGQRQPEELAQMVDVNLRAPIALTRMALPHLQAADRGFVINVTSLAGKIPLDGAATYSATKFGLRAFSFALAEELRGTSVTVSAVSPGPVDTGFIMDDIDEVADITFSQPVCTADEVADMVLDCADDGVRERQWPVMGGTLATVAYLFPWVRRVLRPSLERRGRRRKAALKRARGQA